MAATAAVGISPKTWSGWLKEDAAFKAVVRATVAKARLSASCQLKAAFLEQLRLGHDFLHSSCKSRTVLADRLPVARAGRRVPSRLEDRLSLAAPTEGVEFKLLTSRAAQRWR